jgi:hypothetical protein
MNLSSTKSRLSCSLSRFPSHAASHKSAFILANTQARRKLLRCSQFNGGNSTVGWRASIAVLAGFSGFESREQWAKDLEY